jgi:hypothetical protein
LHFIPSPHSSGDSLKFEEVAELRRTVAAQRNEITRLKGGPGRPNIKPSGMDKATEPKAPPAAGGEPRLKGSKTSKLSVHEERTVKVATPPRNSRFKGYTNFVVQDLVIRPHVVNFRCERWQTPDGATITASLPAGINGCCCARRPERRRDRRQIDDRRRARSGHPNWAGNRGLLWVGDIDAAFAGLMEKRSEVLLVSPSSFFSSHRMEIVALAAQHRVPALYFERDFAEAGGLMSYACIIQLSRRLLTSSATSPSPKLS